MAFDIPMNTKGAMGAGDLLSLNGGMQQQVNNYQQPVQGTYLQTNQNNYQQTVQNNYKQPVQNNRPQPTGVILKKGQKVPLAGNNGSVLTRVQVGLGWDIINQSCDLDASAFMLGVDNKVIGDDWFVFYGQTVSPDGSIRHSGDSAGEGYGDDEVIDINLSAINPNVRKIVFVVTINEALERGLNFSMVSNAYVRVSDASTGVELIRFNLSDYYANVTSMMVGEIYNHNGQWKFNAIGDGVAKDLAGLCGMYGVNVAG